MISQQLIAKYAALEEKRYQAAIANKWDTKSHLSALRALDQWGRIASMYLGKVRLGQVISSSDTYFDTQPVSDLYSEPNWE